MKLQQEEFTASMKGKIVEAERNFERLCKMLNQKFKPVAMEKHLDCQLEMTRTGHDSFVPYYCSEITLGLVKKDDALDIHRFIIWECQREFLGLTVKWNIPGSKVVGEYMDETYEHIAKVLEEHMESYLK